LQGRKNYLDENGYLRFKDSDILVHRYVAEKKLGRPLHQDEVVHHKNRDKLDNSPENLWVFANQEEHDRVHKIDAYRHGKSASYQGFGTEDYDDEFHDDEDNDDEGW
jgi:hypothetical protein